MKDSDKLSKSSSVIAITYLIRTQSTKNGQDSLPWDEIGKVLGFCRWSRWHNRDDAVALVRRT